MVTQRMIIQQSSRQRHIRPYPPLQPDWPGTNQPYSSVSVRRQPHILRHSVHNPYVLTDQPAGPPAGLHMCPATCQMQVCVVQPHDSPGWSDTSRMGELSMLVAGKRGSRLASIGWISGLSSYQGSGAGCYSSHRYVDLLDGGQVNA